MTKTLLTTGLRLVAALDEAGHDAYLVGGCVRDHVMGLPAKDVDVTTSATPEEVAALFPGATLVGAHFGVCVVPFEGEKFEVATFRTDGVYTDGRRPDAVTYSKGVLDDLQRRDFTMNALLMNRYGKVVDCVRGVQHIEEGRILAVGNPLDRFRQDALRMLRAVRFAARFNFQLDPPVAQAIRDLRLHIGLVSVERVTQEVTGILQSGNAAYGVQLLLDTGLLDEILPEVAALVGCPQNPVHHPEGDVFVHTLGLLRQLEKGCSPSLAWAALLHDTGKPATLAFKEDGLPTAHGHEDVSAELARKVANRFKFSTELKDVVVSHCAQHMRFRVVDQMKRSKLLTFVGQPNFSELLALHRLDAMAGRGNLAHHDFAASVLTETPEEVLHPVKLLTGHDLHAIGLTPGPAFRVLLEALQVQQLEGTVTTRQEALQFVQGLLANPSLVVA